VCHFCQNMHYKYRNTAAALYVCIHVANGVIVAILTDAVLSVHMFFCHTCILLKP